MQGTDDRKARRSIVLEVEVGEENDFRRLIDMLYFFRKKRKIDCRQL